MKHRETFWNAASSETYASATEEKKRQAVAEHDGEHIASNLENIWKTLGGEERQLIEYLYLSDKPTVVALNEIELYTGLMEKGLLHTPPGVGTLFMEYSQTTYTIPNAVWAYLQKHSEHFFTFELNGKSQRLKELTLHFKEQVDALLKGVPSSSDTNDRKI